MTRKEPSHPARAKTELIVLAKEEFYKVEILKAKKKYPRIEQIISGLKRIDFCNTEKDFYWIPYEKIIVKLFKNIGEEWPDLLSDYHWEQYLILSKRTLDIFNENGITDCIGDEIEFLDPIPQNLINKIPPKYFWVNGEKLIGAEVDYEKSGYRGGDYCQECGTLRFDVVETMKFMDSNPGTPFVFKEGSWNGKIFFTTGRNSYFCNKEFLEVAKKNRLTNFRFVSLQEGLCGKSFSYF